MDVLLLTLNNAVYAVRKDEVADVRPCPPLFRPPLTPKEMAGVVSLDGRTCVLADLSAALGSAPLTRKDGLVALILDADSELPGFVLREKPRNLTLPELAESELPLALQSNICSSWIVHEGCVAPMLNMVALQQLLIEGGEADNSKAQQLSLPIADDQISTHWQVMLHGKPFAIAAQGIRKVVDDPVLAPLYSLPDFIPALLLDEGCVIPCCDLSGLLLDAPLYSAAIWVADLGLSSLAFWVDKDTQPQTLVGEIHLLAPLVARMGLDRALVSSGQVYPLIDLAALLAAGLSWHHQQNGDQLLALEGAGSDAVVEISLHGARYALPRGVVASEMPVLEITPLPAAPAIICGLSLFEGELLPVFDFTPYFGRRAEISAQSRLLLIKERSFKALLLVDEVLQGRHLSADAYRQLPFQLKESLVCGCYVDEKDVVLVLDPLAMACSFREEIVRDFRRHLVASGLVGADGSAEQGDWWEVPAGIQPEDSEAQQESPSEVGDEREAIAAVAGSEEVLLEQEAVLSEATESDQDEIPGADVAEPAEEEPASQDDTEDLEQAPEELTVALPGRALDEALEEIAPNLLFDDEENRVVAESATDRFDAVIAETPADAGQAPLAAEIDINRDAADLSVVDTEDGASGSQDEPERIEPAPNLSPPSSGPVDLAPEAPQIDKEVSAAVGPETPDVAERQESSTDASGTDIPVHSEEQLPKEREHREGEVFAGAREDELFEASDDEAQAQPAQSVPDSCAEVADIEGYRAERAADESVEEVDQSDEEGENRSALHDDSELVAAFDDSGDDALQEEDLSAVASEASEIDRDDKAAGEKGAPRGILWSHAGGQELSQQPLPHVQHEPHATARKPRAGRWGAVFCAVLLLLIGIWWLSPSVVSPPSSSEQPVSRQEPVKLVAQSAPAPAPAGLQGKGAEPRIPQAVSDASLGKVAQEQITIVIPAELLKSSLDPQDLEIVIARGDTLWEIAERYTGDPWNYRRIARENNIRNPNLIFPRQKLNIRTEE